MSYASVAASGVSPDMPQPQPNPALLNTGPPQASGVTDDTAKVTVVAQSFRDSPRTYTSEKNRFPNENGDDHGPSSARPKKDKRLREVEAEGAYLWVNLKRYLLLPETAGGCLGLVNLGLLGAFGRTLYVRPGLRRDSTFIFSAAAAMLGIVAIEGIAAEKYRQTPRGRAEERRAKEEGAYIFTQARDIVFRPKVLGGLVGLFNTTVLVTGGYLAYMTWDHHRWDRRMISGLAVGLLALFSGEGWLAKYVAK